jgi:hypothetical protein
MAGNKDHAMGVLARTTGWYKQRTTSRCALTLLIRSHQEGAVMRRKSILKSACTSALILASATTFATGLTEGFPSKKENKL